MKKLIHPLAGAIALLTIATFWLSTALAETLGAKAAIVAVKTTIPWGFLLLIPALAATGGTGFSMARGRNGGLIGAKTRRMRLIAVNGLLVLVPSALFLAMKAKTGTFDAVFYGVQGIELIAGATNLALLSLNMRDGLKMASGANRRRAGTQR